MFEREAPGPPWQATTPSAPAGRAGSLALFREGGALRAVLAAGGLGAQGALLPAPPGFPPTSSRRSESFGARKRGSCCARPPPAGATRSHELDANGPPGAGELRELGHALPARPGPRRAGRSDRHAGLGGGRGRRNTHTNDSTPADVERYPADGVKPTGAGEATVPRYPERDAAHPQPEHEYATFALAGNADARPPVRLAHTHAPGTPACARSGRWRPRARIGARVVLYTGPSRDRGEGWGARRRADPVSRPRARTRTRLDLRRRSERPCRASRPRIAKAPSALFLEQAPVVLFRLRPRPSCQHEECGAAYALDSNRAPRVIVLDESSGEVGPEQLQWLEAELQGAKSSGEPAIAVGHADLNAALATGAVWATELVRVLVTGTRASADPCATRAGCAAASAYFYDSPEENVTKPLRIDGEQIGTFGSGTLGYVNVLNEGYGNFHGASGVPARPGGGLRARSADQPRAGERPLDPGDRRTRRSKRRGGTLLRRSEAALFDGLARRPRAGNLGEWPGDCRPAPGRPLHPDSRAMHRQGMRDRACSPNTRSAPRTRKSASFVKHNTAAAASPARCCKRQGRRPRHRTGGRTNSRPVLRLQRRHDDRHDQRRRTAPRRCR